MALGSQPSVSPCPGASGPDSEGSTRGCWCLRPSLRRTCPGDQYPHPGGSHPELCLEAVLEAESQVKGLEGQGRLRQSLPMSQARPSAGSGAQPSGEGPPLHPPLPLAQAGSPRTPTLSLYLLGLDFCAEADPEGPRPCFRSRMVTSWLAARGPRQGSGIQGGISPAPQAPPPTLGRAGQQGPGVALREAPALAQSGRPLPVPALQGSPRPLLVFRTVMGRL